MSTTPIGVYGKELIIDLHNCDHTLFNRRDLTSFFEILCDDVIHMERADLYFWDDEGVPEEERQTDPKTKGTSAVQFILTSNVTVHALDLLGRVYINIFSCDDFDDERAIDFCENFFKGTVESSHVMVRH